MPAVQSLTSLLVDSWPAVLTTVVAFVAALTLPGILRGNSLSQIPLVGEDIGNAEKRRQEFLKNAKSLYFTGYEKVSEPPLCKGTRIGRLTLSITTQV